MQTIPHAYVVGSLMYVVLGTSSNICFIVGMVTSYRLNPSLKHETTIKHIFKYLRRTRDYMFVF